MSLTETLPARFSSKVRILDSGCWEWTAALDTGGYGKLAVAPRGSFDRAHRISYRLFIGPIPDGMTLDHTCHNADAACAGGESCRHRRCVNPFHLEAVTMAENILRGRGPTARHAHQTECVNGHAFTPENTYLRPEGGRKCRICRNASVRRWKEARK